MTRLFIFVSHGNKPGSKMLPKTITSLDDPKMLAIAAHHIQGDTWDITGSSALELPPIRDKEKTSPPMQIGFDVLLSKINSITMAHGVKSKDIYLYCEANVTKAAEGQLTTPALSLAKNIQPHTIVFFTGTPECRRFVHYWRDYHQYPMLELPEEMKEDSYDTKSLSGERLAELETLSKTMSLQCTSTPPNIAVLDKPQCIVSINFLLDLLKNPKPPKRTWRSYLCFLVSDGYCNTVLPTNSDKKEASELDGLQLQKSSKTKSTLRSGLDFFGCCCNTVVPTSEKTAAASDTTASISNTSAPFH